MVVVVGVDESDEAKAVLHFALDEAALRGSTLRIVHAWTLPLVPGGYGIAALPSDYLERLRTKAEGVVDQALSESPADGRPPIERRVVQGSPSQVLIEASQEADLLVVGSRGRGGFAGLLLGSVSQQCAQHAHCPVVVVRRSR
jgi:nucleotide-binding universal stress UspA family protein